MKKVVIIILLTLIIAVPIVYNHQSDKLDMTEGKQSSNQTDLTTLVEESTYSYQGALKSQNLSKYYEIISDEISITNPDESLNLIGVDSEGYYFDSNENDGEVTYSFYDIQLKKMKTITLSEGSTIYNTIFHNGVVYRLSKETATAEGRGIVRISKIDFATLNVKVIFEDYGNKYPIFAICDNKIFMSNVYMDNEKQMEYRVTQVNLDNGDSKIIDSVDKMVLDNGFKGEEIVRIGGIENILYIEYGEYNNELGKEVYYVKKLDLSNNRTEIINLQDPVDFISGDSTIFIARKYADEKAIHSYAVSFYIKAEGENKYQQYAIGATDSFRNPYSMCRIGQLYLLLQTDDIKVIDRRNMIYDTITYRGVKDKGKRISRPFFINDSIYLMYNGDDKNPSKLTIIQYKFDAI